MDDNINKLKEEFNIIKNKGWIKSISNSDGSVGTTFESLLGIKENHSVLPDYNNIELKCSSSGNFYPITLFSTNFDGPSKFETLRIANTYGKEDSVFKNKKTIYASLSTNKNYLVNDLYYFCLKIDKESRMIYLVIKDKQQNILEEKCFIRFDTIEAHLKTKLSYLAMITAKKNFFNKIKYFKYINLDLYKLKDINSFIEAVEKDIIIISLILRIRKSKDNFGKPDYKNISFSIRMSNLNYIFSKYQ